MHISNCKKVNNQSLAIVQVPLKQDRNKEETTPKHSHPHLFLSAITSTMCCNSHAICSPWHLHGVLGEIDNPVDQVKGAKRKGKEDAWVFVNDAGASQNVVGWYCWALLQESLGINRWVGECFGRALKKWGRVHSLLQHTAGIHLQQTKK